MSVHPDRLTETGRQARDRVAAALRDAVGHRRRSGLPDDVWDTAATVAVEAMHAQLGAWRDEQAHRDVADALAEMLFDAAHENCDEVCTGGGMLVWRDIAHRLVDPYGPLAAVAVKMWQIRDEVGDPAAEVVEGGWLPTLRARLDEVGRALDTDETDQRGAARLALAVLSAWAAEYVIALDRKRDAERPGPAGGV